MIQVPLRLTPSGGPLGPDESSQRKSCCVLTEEEG